MTNYEILSEIIKDCAITRSVEKNSNPTISYPNIKAPTKIFFTNSFFLIEEYHQYYQIRECDYGEYHDNMPSLLIDNESKEYYIIKEKINNFVSENFSKYF